MAVDGSEAVVWVEGQLSQAAFVHAMPPANRMAQRFERLAAKGTPNLWNEKVLYARAESALGAASMCEGFALSGGRATTFTGGQGLVQMIEVLHTAAGKRLPLVFHAASISLASQALTMQAGHDDINAIRDCGWGILCARNPQEAADLAVIARRAAELAETPFLNVQDGFITSHGLATARLPEPELMKIFIGSPERRVRNVFNPAQPLITSPLENQDSYMRGRIAQRFFYERVRPSLETAMADWAELTGRRYGQIHCYRMEDAEYALVGVGSWMDTAETAIEALRAKGVRVGAVSITVLRPFPANELVNALSRCRGITVIERADAPLAVANPITEELKAALAAAQMGEDARLLRVPEVYSGSAGLGGAAISPAQIAAAIENMSSNGRRFFVLGIKHPEAVTPGPEFDARPQGAYTLRIHSRAGFGVTSAAKLIGVIASESFGVEVKVESAYRGEERVVPMSASVTFASKRILANADPVVVDVAAVHHAEAFEYSDPLAGLRAGGTLFLESEAEAKEVWTALPVDVRRELRERHIDLFVLNSAAIARETAGAAHRAERARGLALLGAFLKVTPWRNPDVLSDAALFASVERSLARFFEHQGAAVVAEDLTIARRGYDEVRLVIPPEQMTDYQTPGGRRARRSTYKPQAAADLVPAGFCDHVIRNYVDGREAVLDSDLYVARSILPAGSAHYRSFRALAPRIPRFTAKRCNGCMECVNLCPDSAIQAMVVEPETIEHVPPEIHAQFSFTAKYYEAFLKKGEAGGLFGLYVDADRCKGCGECAEICGTHQALEMVAKAQADLDLYDRAREFFESLPDTPARFINEKSLGDILLSARARLHTGGAGSCTGCGESSAIRMMLAAAGFAFGANQIGVVAAAGCHTAANTTYPFNPFKISWTNTLAANAASDAMGIRMKWDRDGHKDRRLWVIGDENALMGAGLHSLNALLDSGLDVKVLVLDKSSLSPVGDLGAPLLVRRNVMAAQTTPAHVNHFYKCVLAANEFRGPAVVISYSACTNDHGIGSESAASRAKLAVDTRTFPLYLFDPRAGDRVRERLDLRGNPTLREDWFKDPKTMEPVDFYAYAKTEGRYAGEFDPEPSARMKTIRQAALMNWRRLQELGGLR
ncbi:MAG: 2-oxoacid:acceptor oxidoreductase family protein [Acidobacteria bacterium]|nr:2-oxoacid:acceptor oxidoreductase family protein [Acidobacteriota bacterium]